MLLILALATQPTLWFIAYFEPAGPRLAMGLITSSIDMRSYTSLVSDPFCSFIFNTWESCSPPVSMPLCMVLSAHEFVCNMSWRVFLNSLLTVWIGSGLLVLSLFDKLGYWCTQTGKVIFLMRRSTLLLFEGRLWKCRHLFCCRVGSSLKHLDVELLRFDV